MMVGQNTVSGQMLTSFIERIETIRTQKKDLAADERAVVAEAVSNGFQAGAIRHVIKLREMKPHDREEAEAVRDGYLHALGMIHDTPLFRQVGLINVDIASRESVIEALKAFVPEKGSIVVEAGGKPGAADPRRRRNGDGERGDPRAAAGGRTPIRAVARAAP